MDSMMAGMDLAGFVLFASVVAVAVPAALGGVWLARRLRVRSGAPAVAPPERDAARDVLRQRYAAGEIEDEEFERRLAGLTWQ